MKKFNINFVGKFPIAVVFSSALVIASIVLFFNKGLRYGVDFKGGAEVQVKFTKTLKIPDIMNTYSFRKNFGQNKHIRSNRRITENRIFEDYFGNNLNLLRCDRKNIETQLVNICYRYFFYKIHNVFFCYFSSTV